MPSALPSKLPRRATRVVKWLLCGVLLTVGAAWELAWPSTAMLQGVIYRNPSGSNPYAVLIVNESGRVLVAGVDGDGYHVDFRPDEVHEFQGSVWWPSGAVTRDNSFGIKTGWPSPSMMGWREWNEDPDSGKLSFEDHWALSILAARHTGIVNDFPLLPLRPVWPGFLLDTALFAALAAALSLTTDALKRSRRKRRGACANCGYPRASGEHCPECGGVCSA